MTPANCAATAASARAHGVIVANTQRGPIQTGHFADQFHVGMQRRIPAVIKAGFRTLDDKAAGIAAITSIGHRTGMNRVHQLHAPEIKGKGAAMIHSVQVFDALLSDPLNHLKAADDLGAGFFGNLHRIRHVILMAVRKQDVIGLDGIDIDLGCGGVWRDEGIKEKPLSGYFHAETGMSVII